MRQKGKKERTKAVQKMERRVREEEQRGGRVRRRVKMRKLENEKEG